MCYLEIGFRPRATGSEDLDLNLDLDLDLVPDLDLGLLHFEGCRTG